MTKDYNDYREWKEIFLYSSQHHFSGYEEYTPDQVFSICKKLLERATEEGLENCFLRFSSTQEPYEDSLGPACVTACGYRRLNQQEREQLEFEDEVERVSKEKGIPFYKARQYLELKRDGIL